MTTIALYNLKGGVGKTASAVNLAYLAAADGHKTLLWDIDQQGSSSFYYKIKDKNYSEIKKLIAKDSDLSKSIQLTDFELLDVIPADNSVKSSDILIEEMKGSKNRLKSLLKQLDKEYDFVFIDCPPGFSALIENVFTASDIVLMPVIPTTLSIRSYHMVKDFIKERDLDAKKMMCFFTMVDMRKLMHQETIEELFKDKKFFQNYIPYLSDVEKMGIYKSPIMEYANSSYAAKCYRELWTEIKEGVL
jgi:cellulose biosynthesis protein BcsQ